MKSKGKNILGEYWYLKNKRLHICRKKKFAYDSHFFCVGALQGRSPCVYTQKNLNFLKKSSLHMGIYTLERNPGNSRYTVQ